MKSRKVVSFVVLLSGLLFLAGCAGSESATPTSVPPTLVPPTVVSTPAPVNPQPGAILTGTIEVDIDVRNALITLEVSEDGAAITTANINLRGPGKCGGVTLGADADITVFLIPGETFPIKQGSFTIPLGKEGVLEGQFTSPTEANGTIHVVGIAYAPTCMFGTANWRAMVAP